MDTLRQELAVVVLHDTLRECPAHLRVVAAAGASIPTKGLDVSSTQVLDATSALNAVGSAPTRALTNPRKTIHSCPPVQAYRYNM